MLITCMQGDTTDPVYWVGEGQGFVFIKVRGRGTYLNAPLLDTFLQKKLAKHCLKYCFFFEECEGMDSTCLGILAGFALKLKSLQGLCILNGMNKRLTETIQLLGLDQFVKVGDSVAFNEEMCKGLRENKYACAGPDFIAEAHKSLIKINAQNKIHFQDVLQYLSSDT